MKKVILLAALSILLGSFQVSCQYQCEGENCKGNVVDTCDDNADCGGITVCDPDLKKCVKRECEDTATLCDGGYVCVKGLCITCKRAGVDCPKGYDCQSGRCAKVVECLIDGDCKTGKCESGKCVQIAECHGDLCADKTVCRQGKCVICGTNDECPGNLVCSSGKCELKPVPKCLKDANCVLGQICLGEDCQAGCRELKDCPFGEKCASGKCVNNPCEGPCNGCGGYYCDSGGKQICDRSSCQPTGAPCSLDSECYRGICELDAKVGMKVCTFCTSSRICVEKYSAEHLCDASGVCRKDFVTRRKQE